MGDTRGAYRVLVGKPEGKRPVERPRPRWEETAIASGIYYKGNNINAFS
jgi:hypothetical protein